MSEFRLETERLILRPWRDADHAPFAAICADPRVMATLGPVMNRTESDALLDRVEAIEAEHGHTFWALERKADSALIGWCGVIRADIAPIDGKAEIGWRLAHDAWGQGYATEAARAALDDAFGRLGMNEVLAYTGPANLRSQAVMRRLGMTREPQRDFLHPNITEGDRRSVVYVAYP